MKIKVIIIVINSLMFSQCTENVVNKATEDDKKVIEIVEGISVKNTKIGEVVANFEIGSKTIIPENTTTLIEGIEFNVIGNNLIDSTLVSCSLDMKPNKKGKLVSFSIASKIFNSFQEEHKIIFTPKPHKDPAVGLQTASKIISTDTIEFISIVEQYNQIGIAEGVYLLFIVNDKSLMEVYEKENPESAEVK